MSAYPTYDKKIMEAIRQLTLEEMLMALHDLAIALDQDRLRDIGLSRQMFGNEEYPVRPAVHGWDAVQHAMQSAGYEMKGFKQKSDLVEFMGEDLAEEVWAAQEHAVEMMSEIGAIMMGEDVDEAEATEIYDMGGHIRWDDPHADDDIETMPLPHVTGTTDPAEKMRRLMEESKRHHPTHPRFDSTTEGWGDMPDDLSGFGWEA